MKDAALRRAAIVLTLFTYALLIAGVVQRAVFPDARGSYDGLTLLPMLIAMAAVGGLVAARRPRNSYGWVLSASAVAWTIQSASADFAALAMNRGWVGVWPATMLTVATAATAWGAFVTFGLLLYPTGSLPTRRWRWVGWAAGAGLALMTIGLMWTSAKAGPAETLELMRSGQPVRESGMAATLSEIGRVLVFSSLLAGVVALFVRRRRADAVERMQLKWFAFGGALVAVSILVAPLVGEAMWLEVAAISVMPVVIGIAILRWHLYDIDRLVSRTLAYAILTVLLVGIYLAAVTALTALTAPVTPDSPVAVAAATLLAAAAFQPARRRIQSVVDRRFNRARYDARRTIEAFASSLRQEVDIEDVQTHLFETVDDVLKPASMTVWLRPGAAR